MIVCWRCAVGCTSIAAQLPGGAVGFIWPTVPHFHTERIFDGH